MHDSRGQGPPADTGTYQMPSGILVFQHTFSGVTYIAAVRSGERGWVLVDHGTDAATVINSALNVGNTFVRAATYTITISIVGINNTLLEGESNESTILTAVNGLNNDVITYVGAGDLYDFKVFNLQINGNKANQASGRGIHLMYARQCVIHRVRIFSCKQDGVYFQTIAAANLPSEISFCYLNLNDGCGIFCTAPEISIIWNQIGYSGLHGIQCYTGGDYKIAFNHVWFSGQLAAGAGSAVYLPGSNENRIIGNTLESSNYDGMYILGEKNLVIANLFCWNSRLANVTYDDIHLYEYGYNIIALNEFRYTAPTTRSNYAVREEAGGAPETDYNEIFLNDVRGANNATPILIIGLHTTRHHNIGFVTEGNRLRGVLGVASVWTTDPTNLNRCTDGDWLTMTGIGSKNVAGYTVAGQLDFDMAAVYNVHLRGKLYSGTSGSCVCRIMVYFSEDGITYIPAAFSDIFLGLYTAATNVTFFCSCFGRGRYIRLTWASDATANIITGGVYEIEAIDDGIITNG